MPENNIEMFTYYFLSISSLSLHSASQYWLVRFTFEQGADLPPAHDSPLTGVLAQCRLQDEQRNTTGHKEKDVRNEEGT